MNNTELSQKARAYVFLLLKYRLRSEKEICERLKGKRYPEQIIKETLDFLKEKQFIDNSVFAQAWIYSRLKKPMGLRRIRQELNAKGIDKVLIDKKFEEIKKDYSEEEVVRRIARDRLERIGGADAESAKRRVYAYLLRRGFSPIVASDILTEL